MRKIIVLAFVTLDGVMQAPGGPEEDTSGGFKYGGWTVPYYVASNTLTSYGWNKSVFLMGDIVKEIGKLKAQEGPELQVHGSSNFIQTLLKNDLIDELWLKVFPITIGSSKRLFGEGTIPAGFKLFESKTSPSGVVVASYARTGEIKTGSFA